MCNYNNSFIRYPNFYETNWRPINGNEYNQIIEIKEKEPIKPKSKEKSIDTKFWSYGWDTRRLLWYLEIQRKIGFQNNFLEYQ